MSRPARVRVLWLAGALFAAAVAVLAADGDPSRGPALLPGLRELLSKQLKFSPGDLNDLESGKVVARRLGAMAPGEAAAAGAVRIAGTKQTFVDLYRDIARFKRGPEVIAIGVFGNPPSAADLASLPLDMDDLNLRNCRVGDCDIRLPVWAIERFKREVNWNAPDAGSHAAALFKELLAENIRSYTSGGPGRITEYSDGKTPIRPVDDFTSLLAGATYLDELAPGLRKHLEQFPADPLPGAEDIVYWSKEKFGSLPPFVTVTHVTIAQPRPEEYVMTSRDVYSSRYFDASLSITVASDSASPDAFYLLYVNRSRADALKGSFAGLRRSIVERRARNSLVENLTLTKARVEGSNGR